MKPILSYLFMVWYALLFTVPFAHGQTLSFQSYTSAQGLSQNSVYSIAETDDGFMWFGTQDGLNRFDGKNFVQVNGKKSSDEKTKAEAYGTSKMITALCADSNNLWVGTTYETVIYDRFTNRFFKPQFILEGFQMPENTWVLKVAKGPRNTIWMLTRNKGVFCYSKTLKKMLPLSWPGEKPNILSLSWGTNGQLWACSEKELYKENSTGNFIAANAEPFLQYAWETIADMLVIKDRIWLITSTGRIQILSSASGKLQSTSAFEKEFSGKKYLSDARLLHQSDSNTVWIGSRSDGLIKINLAAKTFVTATAYENSHSLQRQFILSLFTSRQKIAWIGTSGGGVSKYDASKPQFDLWRSSLFKETGATQDNMILSVFSPDDRVVYMGTMVSGLLVFNDEKNSWDYFLPENLNKNPASKNIYAITAGQYNTLWLSTWAGLYNFNEQTKKFTLYTDTKDEQTKELTALIALRQQSKLLTGGYRGALRLFNLDSKQFELPKDPYHILDSVKLRVRYMKEASNGNIYMGTEANGFIRYNYSTGIFTFYSQFNKISSDCRYFCFSNGNAWIATTDGLIQADSASMQIKKIWSMNDGLPNNYIYAVETDGDGLVWMSSNAGICSLNPATGMCQKFKEENGLQGMEYNTAAVYKSNNNNIWFGGINGVNRIKISKVKMAALVPDAPLLTNIKVMNTVYSSDTATPYLHAVTFPYNKNFISFEFQAPVFSQTENVIYEYRLTGVDTGWVNSGTRNFANYTQLKPGHYNFFVRCANADMVWSKETSAIAITITPPWYGTWWFRVLSLFSAAFLVVAAIKMRINNIHKQASVKQKITETEMAALKAQMNPHFMFNCINSIDAFIQSNDKYNATLYLNKFAKLIRNVLDSSKENTVAFSKDIDSLKLYTELEQLRSDHSFKVIYDIDEELLNGDYKVPPLIVQPFIENAIIHGLRNKETKDGLLEIKISLAGNRIKYLIKDNGIGRAAAATINSGKEKSYGMQMSQDRVMLFNKEKEPSVAIADSFEKGKPVGTEVSVHLNMA